MTAAAGGYSPALDRCRPADNDLWIHDIIFERSCQTYFKIRFSWMIYIRIKLFSCLGSRSRYFSCLVQGNEFKKQYRQEDLAGCGGYFKRYLLNQGVKRADVKKACFSVGGSVKYDHPDK